MNKKINVLSLAVAACAFGALAFTSCASKGKQYHVRFHTNNGFIKQRPGTFVWIDEQKVTEGKTIKEPAKSKTRDMVRYTWTGLDDPEEFEFAYWSEYDESGLPGDTEVPEKFDFDTKLYYDVELYPVYKSDTSSASLVCCISLECDFNKDFYTKNWESKIFIDNYFNKGAKIGKGFGNTLDTLAIKYCLGHDTEHLEGWSKTKDGTSGLIDFDQDTIDGDMHIYPIFEE